MSQVTLGPEILLAGGDAGLWSLVGGDWRAETKQAKLRGFLVVSASLLSPLSFSLRQSFSLSLKKP